MAIKYLLIVLFFALVIIKPVHDNNPDDIHKNSTHTKPEYLGTRQTFIRSIGSYDVEWDYEADYLWMYLVFAYLFTGIAMYLIIVESRKIIEVRQNYLGSQSTVTDRTIRLSGIPKDLQSESKIKDFIEELEIGKVDSVLLCRDWKALDVAMEKRNVILRKLERALVEHDHKIREERSLESLPTTNSPNDSDREDSGLLEGDTHISHPGARPIERIWYGRFSLRYRHVDAIDYHEEKLRKADEEILQLRKSEFPTVSLAFVTMDSVAACQMAIQAVLDSSPLQLIATTSPAPVNVEWKNTYMPRRQRLFRLWTITAVILLLTLFWTVVLAPIALFIDMDRIKTIWPQLAKFLSAHDLGKSMVSTQLPTLIISGLNVVVPYLYSCKSAQLVIPLSNTYQGYLIKKAASLTEMWNCLLFRRTFSSPSSISFLFSPRWERFPNHGAASVMNP